ncbi:MAG: DUF3526 domain-containing protein [Vicinamibacteraceae bacterium]
MHNRHFARLANVHMRQAGLYQAGALLGPLAAVQSLSMALAGTDYAHYQDFLEAAERYRTKYVDVLNQDVLSHQPAGTWEYTRGRELWDKVPPFEYQLPGTAWALKHQAVSLALLAAWVVAVVVLVPMTLRQVRVE